MFKTLALLLMTCMTLVGQAIIPRPVPPRPFPPFPPFPPPVIKLPDASQCMPIEVRSVDINVSIAGILAETTVKMTFHNPNPRVLEGELVFPLPPNATVSGYALDINNAMVDGVIVPKDKARVVFEEITRQGIDPGLVEHAAGNQFKTRVYPLNPNGTRTVSVSYVSTVTLVKEKNTMAAYYVQPLRFPNKLDSFKLNMKVAAAQKPPQVVAGQLANLQFKNWETAYVASTELKDIELTEDLYVAVMTRPEQSFVTQKAPDNETYFAFNKVLAPVSETSVQRPFFVLWDASYSRSKSDHSREYQFLKLILKDQKDIPLVLFRNKPEKPVICKNADELLKHIQSAVYDGGTNLAQALECIPDKVNALLFSDGFDTFSLSTPSFNKPNASLSAFYSDKDQNAPVLKGLTAKTGGIDINLNTNSPEQAIALYNAPRTVVTAVKADTIDLAKDIAWNLDGDKLAIAGKLPQNVKNVSITLSVNGKLQTITLPVADSALQDGKLVKTNYGNLKIASLIAENADDATLTQAGVFFNLVTPTTSLLVLDNLGQYLKYSIRPPDCLPEWQAEYDKRHQDKKVKNDDFTLEPNNMKYVQTLWDKLVAWHKKDFPKTATAQQLPPQARAERAAAPEAAAAMEDGAMVGATFNAVAHSRAPMAMSAERRTAKAKSAGGRVTLPGGSRPTTTLKPWKPDTPYLKQLQENKNNAYETYLKERNTYGDAPSFYMDCADFFIEAKQTDTAVRVLSTIAELEHSNKQLLRILAYKLRFIGELKHATVLFQKVLKLAPEEPQSYRDLALVLDDQERFQEAADQYMMLVNHKFNRRFPEIEAIALTELNRVIARANQKNITIKNVPESLVHNIDTDIRIVLNWDADMTDMDLWTIDPFNVKCYYGYRNTPTGGYNSCDFTQGYGPEIFMIRNAIKGTYKIQANYYGSHSQKVLGPVTLYTEIYTNYGRPDEKREVITYRLTGRREVVDVATIDHDGVNRPQLHTKPFHYQVKTGDTLRSIAKRFLGDEKRVDDILKLNPTITAPDNIRIGTIIVIPPNAN